MRFALTVLTAVLAAPPISAQPERPREHAPTAELGAMMLSDLERLCRSGNRGACDEAAAVRAKLSSAMAEAERARTTAPESVSTSRDAR